MTKDRIISPKGRLELIPFSPTKTNHTQSSGSILIEEYSPLPRVDITLPEMDHHVLILNSQPPECEVLYNCSGERYRGVWQENDFALVPAFSENEWVINEENSTCIHFLIPTSELTLFAEEEAESCGNGIDMDLFFNRQDDVLKSLSTLLYNEMQQCYYHGTTYIESLEKALISHLIQHYTNRSVSLSEARDIPASRYNRVTEYIDAHLGQKITLTELASLCHCTPHHFSRAFKRDMGVTPHRYIIRRRVRAAIGLIRSQGGSGQSLSVIADLCGFTDQSHMTRHIKQETGATPLEIRRS